MTAPSRTLIFRIAIGIAVVLALLLLLLAMLPWGAFKGRAERALSSQIGAPVTIGAIERRSFFSFTPLLDIRDLRIAQPDWAGTGEMVQVERVTVRLPVLPILIGRFAPEPVEAANGRLTLIRAKDGRKNWERESERRSGGGSGLERLAVTNLILDYRDAKKERRVTVRIDSDPRGFRASGTGALADEPVSIEVRGAPIAGRVRWPFRARLAGPRTRIAVQGAMAAPFDTRDMAFDIAAQGADLLDVDRVIEAGLFGTQPVKLVGRVSRKGDQWQVERLAGTIGKSRLSSATASIDKSTPGRTRIDGDVALATLRFDDLANDRGLAVAAARRARIGDRLIPSTQIDLKSVSDVDGALRVRVGRIVGTPGFRAARATLALDAARLTVDPFVMEMTPGRLSGRIVIDQRDGKSEPTLNLDLTLRGSRIAALAGDGVLDAPLQGRVRLSGPGDTIRSAVGRSTGSIALVGGTGRIPANIASYLGLDVGRGALVDGDKVATLRCMILRLEVKNGTGRMAPFLIDTSRSQSRFNGSVDLSNERLSLAMTGSPKKESLLRLTKPVPVSGTIKAPSMRLPDGAKPNVGGVLKLLGDAIAGDRPPLAQDANCSALAATALR